MEWVYRLSQARKVDYATLRACALVCRAWTPIAQRLLFRRVPYAGLEPDSRYARALLLRTLRTSPHLSAAVRSIFIEVSATSSFSVDVELLELCPHVQNIVAHDLLDGSDMVPALEARLRAISLRSVTLGTWGDPSFVRLFLRVWPDLRSLDLSVGGTWWSDPPDELISASGALQTLSLKAEDIAWVLLPKNDFTALRDLELLYPTWYESGWIEQLHRSDLLRGIHTLRVVQGSFPPQDVLERTARLESLVFHELPREDVVLPRSLRHVGYHPWHTHHEAKRVASYAVAALRALPDLKLVTATRLAGPAQLAALEEVCCDRGVEFVTYRSPRHFPNPRWDVDWI